MLLFVLKPLYTHLLELISIIFHIYSEPLGLFLNRMWPKIKNIFTLTQSFTPAAKVCYPTDFTLFMFSPANPYDSCAYFLDTVNSLGAGAEVHTLTHKHKPRI